VDTGNPGLAHQPLDPFAAAPQTEVTEAELGVHPGRPIRSAGELVDVVDAVHQHRLVEIPVTHGLGLPVV
jgi:hypothetical protein